MTPSPTFVVANRILAAEGVLDGFGHVSIRDPRDPACYLMSRSLAPALVTAADIVQHDLDNKPTQDRGQALYYERWIHGEVYKARPQVNGRSFTAISADQKVVPFASTKAPLALLDPAWQCIVPRFRHPGFRWRSGTSFPIRT